MAYRDWSPAMAARSTPRPCSGSATPTTSPPRAPYHDGEISVAEAARRLGCSTGVIYYWIQAGQLDTRRGPGNRLCITWNDPIQAACRDRVTTSGHLNPRSPAHRAPPPLSPP